MRPPHAPKTSSSTNRSLTRASTTCQAIAIGAAHDPTGLANLYYSVGDLPTKVNVSAEFAATFNNVVKANQ